MKEATVEQNVVFGAANRIARLAGKNEKDIAFDDMRDSAGVVDTSRSGGGIVEKGTFTRI
jgi:hypothetical protein